MNEAGQACADNEIDNNRKSHERNAFLFICIVLFPVLSVAIVGSFGLVVWLSQMIFGPPSAP